MNFGALTEVGVHFWVHAIQMTLFLVGGAVGIVILVLDFLAVRVGIVGEEFRDFYSRRGGLAFVCTVGCLLLFLFGLLLFLFLR